MHINPQNTLYSSNIDHQILSLTFQTHHNKLQFYKTAYAKDPELLYKEVDNYVLPKNLNPERIVILATSGIPFGVVLSQKLKLPIHFFKHACYKVSVKNRELQMPLLPVLPPASTVLIADSHARYRNALKNCILYLQKQDSKIIVQGLLTLIGLDHLHHRKIPEINEYHLISLLKNSDFLSYRLDINKNKLFDELLEDNSTTWNRPHSDKSIIQPLRIYIPDVSKSKTISEYTPNFLRQHHHSTRIDDIKIWDEISNPKILISAGIFLKQRHFFDEFDILVGTKTLGSSLAWALAYHSGFKGPIFSVYEKGKITPMPNKEIFGKKVLIIQSRIITGLETKETMSLIKREGGLCNDVLTLYWNHSLANNARKKPLKELILRGVNFHIL